MNESITAYQGKSFCVNLESHLGSTNYGWCLISMPKGIILAGQANDPVDGLSLVTQKFFFIAVEAPKKQPVEIEFGLCCLTQVASELSPFKYEERVVVHVQVVPSNGVEGRRFVKYNENEAHYAGHNADLLAALKYGYPPLLKYGYPCVENECVTEKYGFPPIVKYGYPPLVKYGYPPTLKYGYPGSTNDECCG